MHCYFIIMFFPKEVFLRFGSFPFWTSGCHFYKRPSLWSLNIRIQLNGSLYWNSGLFAEVYSSFLCPVNRESLWGGRRWTFNSNPSKVRGFKPGRSRRICQGEKILITPSFGGEVKPSVPSRRFTACKRSLTATWNSGISGKIHRPFLAHTFPPLATRISGETTSGESWNV
jgi:hypothetical protein